MGKCLAREKTPTIKLNHMSSLQRDIRQTYTLQKHLGSGSFGIVRLAHKPHSPSIKYAIKSLDKSRFQNPQDIQMIKTELDILLQIDHPNIIKLYQSYQDQKYLHIVTQYCSGGMLWDRLIKKKRYSQKQAAKIMKMILRAVGNLHAVGVCHRDIKPENFMYTNPSPEAQIKLIDFGLSAKFKTKFRRMKTIVGSPLYMAPQVLDGNYSCICDIWSVGVVLYQLLSGTCPFKGSSVKKLIRNIRRIQWNFSAPIWKKISSPAKDLISNMLTEVQLRFTASLALKHMWFKQADNTQKIRLNTDIVSYFQNVSATKKFQQAALIFIVKNLEYGDIQELKNVFMEIDTEQTGYLSQVEIQRALRQQGQEISKEDIKKLVQKADFKGDGRINYSEFLAATLRSKIQLNQETLWNAFTYFDTDNTGFITVENLREALFRTGRDLQTQEVEEMINEVDLERDNRISFVEFQKMLGV